MWSICSYTFLTVLAASHKFWHVVSSFPFISKYFLNSLWFFSFTHWLLRSVFLISTYLWICEKQKFFLFAFTPLYKENSLCMILILLSLLWLVSWCIVWPTLENVPLVILRQIYILPVLDGVFYRYLLSLIHLCWSLLFPCWSSV